MKRARIILMIMTILFSLLGCSTNTEQLRYEAGTNNANLLNGGRFAVYDNLVLGPFMQNCSLAVYSKETNDVDVVSDEMAFNVLIIDDQVLYLNQSGDMIAISTGQGKKTLVEGPITYFTAKDNETLICLLYNKDTDTSSIRKYSLDGRLIQTIYSHTNSANALSGKFALDGNKIFLPINETGMLEIDINSGKAEDISKSFQKILNLGILRQVVCHDGFMYFLGQIFDDELQRPTFLFKMSLADKTIEQIADENTTQYTMDNEYIYFSCINENGGCVMKQDLHTSQTVVLCEDIYPSSLEILDDYLCCNVGNEFHCNYSYIRTHGDG